MPFSVLEALIVELVVNIWSVSINLVGWGSEEGNMDACVFLFLDNVMITIFAVLSAMFMAPHSSQSNCIHYLIYYSSWPMNRNILITHMGKGKLMKVRTTCPK